MPTIADEFIVRLGLDPTSFRAGAEEAERLFNKTKDAARKSGKQMEESNKTLAETFNVVKRELIGFYAAMLGGRAIKEFIGDTTEAAASLGRFAQNIGAMPEQVVGWEAAVERMGGTAEDANKSLNAMSKALFDVRNMGQPLAPELYRLQAGFGEIAATRFDTGHGVVPFMDDIAAQAKKLAEVDPQGAFRLLQGAGISDSVANTMIKYGSGMSAYVDSIGNSIAPTKEAIKSAQDLQDKWEQVKQTIQGIGNDSLPALDTALSPILNHMNAFLQKMRDAEKATTGHATPIPWGDWFSNTKRFFENESLPAIGNFFEWSAHGAELPQGRASTGLSGEHSLKVHGQDLSSSNPLPVDVVRNSIITPGGQGNGNYGDSTSLLGGPMGSGGQAPAGNTGGGTAGGASRLLRDRAGLGSSGPALTTGQQNAAAMHMIDRLMAHGWTEESASIAAGNAMQESGFNPRASGDPSVPGGSHGYMQWNRGRLAALKAFASGQGKDWQDRDVQIDFLDKEAREKIPAWPSQRSLESAGQISHAYEGYGATRREGGLATPISSTECTTTILRQGERTSPISPLPGRRLLVLLTSSIRDSALAAGPSRRLLPTIKFPLPRNLAVNYPLRNLVSWTMAFRAAGRGCRL